MANEAPAKVTVAYTNQPCRRKLQFINGKFAVQKPQTTTVQRRNERERNRVKLINRTFTTLRDSLPASYHGRKERKLSKVEVLNTATSYIAYLMRLLQEDDARRQRDCYGYPTAQQQQQQQQQQLDLPDLLPEFLESDDDDELRCPAEEESYRRGSSSCEAASTESGSSPASLHQLHLQYCQQQQQQQQQQQFPDCVLQFQQQQPQQQQQQQQQQQPSCLHFSTPVKQLETSPDCLQSAASSLLEISQQQQQPLSVVESLLPITCFSSLS